MRRALLSFLAATLMSLEARAADSGGQFAVKGIGGNTCEGFITAKSESSDAYWMFLGWLDGYMTGINQYSPETYDITPWQSQNLLAALFKKFCAKNPGANFFAVANKMVVELRDDRLRHPLALCPVNLTHIANAGERLFDLLDPGPDLPSIGLNLGFAGTAEKAKTAALALQMGP